MSTWIKGLTEQRTRIPAAQNEAAAQAANKPRPKDVDLLVEAGLAEKLAQHHAANLAVVAPEVRAITALGKEMQPRQAQQLQRGLSTIWSELGKSLGNAAPPVRKEVAEVTVKTLAKLATTIGPEAELAPSLSVMLSLLDIGVRTPESFAASAEAAGQTVEGLLKSLQGREGASTALFTFRNIVDRLVGQAREGSVEQRQELWQAIADYVAGSTSMAGIDQATAANLARVFEQHLAAAPNDPGQALRAAGEALTKATAGTRQAATQHMQGQLNRLPEGTPQRRAVDDVFALLQQINQTNPGSTATLSPVVQTAATRFAGAAAPVNENNQDAWKGITALVREFGATPVGEGLIAQLAAQVGKIVDSENGRAAMKRLAEAGNLKDAPAALLEAYCAVFNKQRADVVSDESVAQLGKLPPVKAMQVVHALFAHLGSAEAPALSRHLCDAARGLSVKEIREFPAHYLGAHKNVKANGVRDAEDIAATLALAPQKLPDAQITGLAQIIVGVQNNLNAAVAPLMLADTEGAPSLYALRDAGSFLRDPKPYLMGLLPAVNEAQLSDAQKTDLARHAVGVAMGLGYLDREPEGVFERILADMQQAIADPRKLAVAPQGGTALFQRTRAAKVDSPTTFLENNPGLPHEVAFTAGVHLNGEQMGWLMDTIDTTRSRDYVRALRDSIFGAVEIGRLDFIDALRTAKSPNKAVIAAATLFAQEYRRGEAAECPIDALIEGLKKGDDPAREILAARAKEALGDQADVAAVNEEAVARLAGVEDRVAALAAHLKPGQKWNTNGAMISDVGPMQKAFGEIVAEARAGKWPQSKYNDDVAGFQLGEMTDRQRQGWIRDDFTNVEGAGAVAEKNPQVAEAMLLLKGLLPSMRKEIILAGDDWPDLKWDAASLDALQQQRDTLTTEVRNAAKGTEAHWTAAKKLGEVMPRLAVLEFNQVLERAFADNAAPTSTTLINAVRPIAEAAAIGAKRLAGFGCAAAIREAMHLSHSVAAAAKDVRAARYVTDTADLDAFLGAYTGGCVNPLNGANRPALVEYLAGAQYKIMVLKNNDAIAARGVVRLGKLEHGNYKGYAVWVDLPGQTGNGLTKVGDAAVCNAWYGHMLAKAEAMGVPLVTKEPLPAAVTGKGEQTSPQSAALNFSIHRGHFGSHHTQAIGEYMTAFAEDAPKDAWKPISNVKGYVTFPPNWVAPEDKAE